MEWELEGGLYMYMQEGDMQINSRNHHNIGFGFPLKHYHGITVAIYIEGKHHKYYLVFLAVFPLIYKNYMTNFALKKFLLLYVLRIPFNIFFQHFILFLIKYG